MKARYLTTALLVMCTAIPTFAQAPKAQDPTPLTVPFALDPADVQAAAAANAHGPNLVAYCSICGGLVSSTGNLYFTNFGINEFGPSSASFYRTGKYSTPGTEGLLHQELGSPYFNFGNVVWAYVNGTYYGYLVANYDQNGSRYSQIKRVPLAGGTAVVLAQSSQYIGVGDLATDGATLFWSDAGGVRSMSVNGGAVTTLASSPTVSHISLDSNYLFYSDGASINRLPKAGGAAATIFNAPATITALYAWVASPSYSVIFWGEQGGGVRSINSFGSSYYTWQNPIAGRDVTSVGYTGARALWIDCTEPGNSVCTARVQSGGVTPTTFSAGVGAGHLQWDTTSMYWIGSPGLQRYIY